MTSSRLLDFKKIGYDDVGYLTPLESQGDIPFDIKRVYYIYDVPNEVKRGFHAHKKLEQLLICVSGKVTIHVEDRISKKEYILDKPYMGLYIGPGAWREMTNFSENCVLLVFASKHYDETDYIREYDEYKKYCNTSVGESDVFIHEKAIVDSDCIGKKTKIWGFTHVLPGASIGENCNLNEHVFVENNVVIGNNVTIKCGAYLWDGLIVEDNVFIGPSVSFVNDKYPRSKHYPEKFPNTILKEGCSLGANSTIMAGVSIGSYSMVGAGSVVLKDVGDYELVVGNPAKRKGFVCKCSKKITFVEGKFVCSCGIKYKKEQEKVFQI